MRRTVIALTLTVAAAIVVWWLAADRIRSLWPDLFRPVSQHEQYARSLEQANLDDTAMGRAWLTSAASALAQPRRVTLPFSASGSFDAAMPAAIAWRFRGVRGRRIEVEVELDADGGRVFVDLFRLKPEATLPAEAGSYKPEATLLKPKATLPAEAGSYKPEAALPPKGGSYEGDDGRSERGGSYEGEVTERVASARDGETTLAYEPRGDEMLIVRLQPELLRGGHYTVQQRAVATLRFPVQGVTARAVRSVFGDVRDRGVRSHEGVDIFAPRGTPVVAASDGWVTGVTTNRLGGKVVWMWDIHRGQALYYAHLDRQDVSPGERVKAGEIVGSVGNTGNARTTPPHLHFGIYRPIEGAIDPLPFICDAPCDPRGMAYAR